MVHLSPQPDAPRCVSSIAYQPTGLQGGLSTLVLVTQAESWGLQRNLAERITVPSLFAGVGLYFPPRKLQRVLQVLNQLRSV